MHDMSNSLSHADAKGCFSTRFGNLCEIWNIRRIRAHYLIHFALLSPHTCQEAILNRRRRLLRWHGEQHDPNFMLQRQFFHLVANTPANCWLACIQCEKDDMYSLQVQAWLLHYLDILNCAVSYIVPCTLYMHGELHKVKQEWLILDRCVDLRDVVPQNRRLAVPRIAYIWQPLMKLCTDAIWTTITLSSLYSDQLCALAERHFRIIKSCQYICATMRQVCASGAFAERFLLDVT